MGRNKKKKRNKKSKKNVDSITRLKAETIRQNVANSSSKTRVKGDLHDKESEPTILIAPDDYVNLFSVKKETSAGSLQKLKPPKPKTDVDMAAANEYRNLFTVQKDSKTKVKTVNQFKIPSDAPTALIAPDDYQNLFTIAKANKESSVKVVNRTDHKAEATPKKMDPLTLKIPSDAPTALIAPEDYQNLFTKQTSSKTKVVTKNLPNVLSDAPTALIAPDDYQNLFTVQKVPKHKIPDKDLNLIKSATPTALIAPEDYQNLFTTQKNSKTKVVEAEKITNILSDSPTALIAPDDYQNLFTTQKPSKPKLVEMAMPKIPSDSPTALIAPDDYQNLFSNLKNNIKYIPEKSASKNENNTQRRMNDAENINLSSSPGSSRRINSVRFGTKRFQQIWLAMKRFSPIHRPNKYDHHYSSSAGTVRKRRKHSADSNDHNESSKMSNWSPFTRRRADNSTKSKRHRLYSSHPELSSTQLNDKDFLHETSKEETVNSESNRSPLNRIKKIKRDMQRCVQRMTSSGEFVAEHYSNETQQDDGNVLVVESMEKKNGEKELVKIDKRRPLQRTTTIDQSSVDNLDDFNDENVEHVKNFTVTRQQFDTEKITLEGAQNYDDLLQRQRISKLLKYPFYQVDIHLRNAINLLAKDSCGTSDPYVKFKVGNQIIHKSRIIFKTLNPNWDEYFVIPVDDIFEPILIKVYDHDYLSVDDYLGTVQVDLTKLDPGVSTDLSLFVQNSDLSGLQNIDKKWGQIFLTVKLNPKTQEEREHFYGRGKWTSMSGDGPMKKVRTQAFDSTVNILLIKAINMRLDTDYYIRFKLGTEKLKSKHVHKSVQSPYWAEQFDLRLFADQSKMLEITICGVSQSTSDFIYKSCIDLSDLEKEKTHHRMVQFEMEHQTSELEILLTITGNQQGLPNLLTTTDSNFSIRYNALHSLQNLSDVGQLIVKVYKAENLVAADINGKSDPFCVLELVNERLRTGTEYKTLSPEWNKMFSFNIMDIHEVLEVTVFDEDKDRSEFLGKVAIPLLKIRNGEKRWYALKDKKLQNRVKGHIQLEFWISYNRFKASIRTMTPREKKYIEPEVKFKRSLFVRNAIRLKNVCLELVEWGQFMHSCIQWESPIRSLVAFIFFLTFVYFFELYMFPLLLLIILLRNYLMLKIEKYFNPNRQEEEIGFIDDNEFEDVDDHDKASEEKKTLKEKLQTVQEISTAVMNILGEMASFIERIKNTANFSVPFLSWLAIICLTLATILLFHIPIRYLILAWGVNKFTKKFRAPHAINNNEILDFLSRVPDIEQKIMYRDFKPNVQSDNRNVPSSPTITTSNNSSSTYNDRCKSSLSKNASFNSDKSNVSLSQFSYDKKKKEKRK